VLAFPPHLKKLTHRTQHHHAILTIQLHHEYGAPQHHPTGPRTKAMVAIMQNRRGRPTATPLPTLWYSGVVRFGRARERRHHLLGCILWVKFGRQGGLISWPNRDGRTELDRLSRSKKSIISQSTVGGLFMFGESAVGRNGGPVCGDGN
jgi:hypothetical protein